jgi:SEC-C motif-containing protein
MSTSTQLCPCKSKKNYAECCEPFITKNALPDTPEKLMRSRYTAYAQANIGYIADTMKNNTWSEEELGGTKEWAQSITWVKLKVIKSYMDTPEKGFVEFKAYYRYKKQMHVMHEFSEFILEGNQWFYMGAKSN